jgi:hypothetical protein
MPMNADLPLRSAHTLLLYMVKILIIHLGDKPPTIKEVIICMLEFCMIERSRLMLFLESISKFCEILGQPSLTEVRK